MRLILAFFRVYPAQITLVLAALLLAGLVEGIGLSVLLPLLNIAVNPDGGSPDGMENEFSQAVTAFLISIGINPTIGVMLSIIMVGFTVKSLLLLFAQRQVGYTAARIATDLRLDLLRAILRTRWQYFLHQPIGKLTNSLATEASRSSEAFVFSATAVTFLIQAVIYGAVALALDWKASLVALLFGGLVIAATHYLVRMARKAGKRQTKVIRSLLSRLTDTLQSVKPLKAMAKEHLVSNVLSAETAELNRALERQVISAALLNAGQDLMLAFVIVGGIYAAIEVFGMPFTTVMVLVLALGRMLSHIGKVQKQYQKASVGESAFWAIRAAIQEAQQAEEARHAGISPTLKDSIRFQQVSFSYDKKTPVLDSLDLVFPAGQLTLLVGSSGAGKTTIMDLTIGLLTPDEGEILVDDVALDKIDLQSWRRMIGYVPQETLLLHDSIRNNVTLGETKVSDEDVRQALADADLLSFVESLPEGIETVVGERGGKLSGGQRQRIMIARALVNRPPLLILDEAASALDIQSKAAVLETLKKLRGRFTILAIAHDDWLSETADRVYRLQAGKVKQLDTHTVS